MPIIILLLCLKSATLAYIYNSRLIKDFLGLPCPFVVFLSIGLPFLADPATWAILKMFFSTYFNKNYWNELVKCKNQIF